MAKAKNNKLTFDKQTIILTAIVALVFLVIGYGMRTFYDSRQNEKAAAAGSEIINNLVAGEIVAAYALTADSLQENQSQEEFVAAMSGLMSEDPRMLEGQTLRGDGKILYQQYVENLPETSTGKTSGDFYITLVKEGNNWRAASISVQ